MSFLSKAYRDPRYDRTITSQEMNVQTTMQFDEINQSPIIDDSPPTPDKLELNYDSDTNKLLWTTQGTSSYLSFTVKYNAQSQTVASTARDFTLPSLSTNTFYSFIVEGLTSFGLTIKSNTVQITTQAVGPSNYEITPLNITTSSFEVSYSFVQNDATNITHIPSIETSSLQSNTEYTVFLTMNYEINGSSFILVSNTITVLTLKEDPVINSFTSPSKDHDEITLNFDVDFNDADASNRVIEIYKDGILHSSSSGIASGYNVSGLTPNTPYQFQLKLQWYFNGVQQPSINSSVLPITTDALNATNPYFEVQSKTSTSITIHNISYGNDDGATRLSNNIYLDNALVSSTIQTSYTFSGLNEGQTYNIKITKTLEGTASLYEFERNITTYLLAIPASNNGSFTTLQASIPANSLKWNINAWNDSIPTSIQVIDATNSTIIATLAYTETNYLHTSLTENTNYSYKIRKVFDTGYNDSPVITLQTYQFAEADTINSFVEDFDEITININNKPNHDATLVSQFILFKKSSESIYQYQKTSFGTTVYGLQENTQYDFQIQKITQIETTQFTTTSPVLTTSTAHRPVAPSISLSSSTPTSLTFNVALNAMNDGILTSFKFQTKSVSGIWSDYETLTASSTSVVYTPLSSNTTYEVRLRKEYSFNGSNYIITTNLSEKTPYNPVIAVSNITFTNVDTNTLTVNWTRNSDGDDTEVIYKVEYYPTATPSAIELVQSTTKTDVDISGLIHNTGYTFIVHKFSFINNTQTTATQSTLDITVGQNIIPSPPKLTLAQIRPTEVDLSFTEEYNGTATSISFNIVYLDTSNTEYVSASIAQNGTGNYTYTLTGLTSNETYRIRVRKSSSLGFVFSDTKTAITPAVGAILPLAPTVNSITLSTNDVSVVYEPRSNGDATTAILEFYYSKQASSITWLPYVQYDTTRNVISDTSQGTFVFDGLEAETVYTLRIKKITNLVEVETIMYVETLDDGGGGGGGGGGFPFPFPIPPPSGSNPDDPDDPDEPEIETNYNLIYDFNGGSLSTTYGLSTLSHTGFTPFFYLNDPDKRRIYSFNNTQKYEATIDLATLAIIDFAPELVLTFKVVVCSLNDYWRVQIGNIEIICDDDTITLKVGGLLNYNTYNFLHTKPTTLFNEYLFTMDQSAINYYQNGSFVSSQIQRALTLYYSDTTIEIENTNSNTFSIFEEINLWWGVKLTAQQIFDNFRDRYPSGQNFGLINSKTVSSILSYNFYNTTQEVNFTESPVGHFTKFTMNGVDVFNDGTGIASRNYVYDSKGSIQEASSSNHEEPIAELTNQQFTLTTTINGTTYNKPTITTNITDVFTNQHLTDTNTYPIIYAEYYCNILNQFVINFYLNSSYNGVYKVINEFSGNIFVDGVDTTIFSNALVLNYGYRVLLPTTIIQVLSGNAYTNALIQNGSVSSIKSNSANMITQTKTLNVIKLPHTSHTTTYDPVTKYYTTEVKINNLVGTEQTIDMEIWVNDLEIDNIIYNNPVTTTTRLYEYAFTGRKLVITGATVPQTLMSFSYKKINTNQFFTDHPFRTILYELGGTTYSNPIYSYKDIPSSFKEYTFTVIPTVVNGQYVDLELRLLKSNEPISSIEIDFNLVTGSDEKRIFFSVRNTPLTATILEPNQTRLVSTTPLYTGTQNVSLGIVRIIPNDDLPYYRGVDILDSHVSVSVNTYTEPNPNFSYIIEPFSFNYRPISFMKADVNSPVGSAFITKLELNKPYPPFQKIKFKAILDNRRLQFVNIEHIDDRSYPITTTQVVSGNTTTVSFELNDTTNALSSFYYIRNLFDVFLTSAGNLVSYDTSQHLTFEMEELLLKDNITVELIETAINQTPTRTFTPSYTLYVNPTITFTPNVETTMDLSLNLPVSNHDVINTVQVRITIDPTKMTNITSQTPLSTSGNSYTYEISGFSTPETNLTDFFTFNLRQLDRKIGFNETDITVELISVTYQNEPVVISSYLTSSWTAQVKPQIWMNASLDQTLKTLDVSLNGTWESNTLLMVIFNSLHHNIPSSIPYGSDPYGWGLSNTRIYTQYLLGVNETLPFDSALLDSEYDTMYYAELNSDIKVLVSHPNKDSSDTVYASIYPSNKFKSHFKLFSLNPVVSGDLYTVELWISKEHLAVLQYMEIDPVYDSNRIEVLNFIEKNVPDITSKSGDTLVYDNSSLAYTLTNPVGYLYKLGKWRFRVLQKTSSASALQIGFQIKAGGFTLNKPPLYSSITAYFNRIFTSIDDTLSYTPVITIRLDIQENLSLPNSLFIDVYADIGYSGISTFTTRITLYGLFNHSITYTDTLVSDNRLSNTQVDLTYTEPVPSVLNNKGEVRLAQLIINSSEPPGSITEEMFVAFVSTSVVGINFEYEKNDFTM